MSGARVYAGAWVALLLLLAASFLLAHAPLGAWATPVALLIAVVKAAVIGAVFMHLRGARASLVGAALTAVALVVTLVGFMVADVIQRAPPQLLTP
jgi:cytochrome c oxidase subunit 4